MVFGVLFTQTSQLWGSKRAGEGRLSESLVSSCGVTVWVSSSAGGAHGLSVSRNLMSGGLNAYLTYWKTQAFPLWQNVTFLWESKTQASEASGSRGEAVGQVDQWATVFTIWDEGWRSRIPFLVLQRLGDEPYTWKKTKWCDLKKGLLSPQFPQNHRKFCQIHLT